MNLRFYFLNPRLVQGRVWILLCLILFRLVVVIYKINFKNYFNFKFIFFIFNNNIIIIIKILFNKISYKKL